MERKDIASSGRRVSLYATIPKDVAVQRLYEPFRQRYFWYNATIEAILGCLNDIKLQMRKLANTYIHKNRYLQLKPCKIALIEMVSFFVQGLMVLQHGKTIRMYSRTFCHDEAPDLSLLFSFSSFCG